MYVIMKNTITLKLQWQYANKRLDSILAPGSGGLNAELTSREAMWQTDVGSVAVEFK